MATAGNSNDSVDADDLAHSEPHVGELVFQFRFGDPDRDPHSGPCFDLLGPLCR